MAKPLTDMPRKLTAAQRAKLKRLIDVHGVAAVAKSANVGVETITRAAGDLPMRPGSIALIATFLAAQGKG